MESLDDILKDIESWPVFEPVSESNTVNQNETDQGYQAKGHNGQLVGWGRLSSDET